MQEERIALTRVVEELREELMAATAAGEGQPLRFDIVEVSGRHGRFGG